MNGFFMFYFQSDLILIGSNKSYGFFSYYYKSKKFEKVCILQFQIGPILLEHPV